MSASTSMDTAVIKRKEHRAQAERRGGGRRLDDLRWTLDPWLLGSLLMLLVIGFVMVTSASVYVSEKYTGGPWYFAIRQGIYICAGLLLGYWVLHLRLALWERWGPIILLISLVLLVAVLIPNIGSTAKGATRWLDFGLFRLQVSEVMKLGLIVYLAGYLVRRGDEVRASVAGFVKPLAIMAVVALLLLLEPDFGTTVVLMATALGMLFLGGVRFWQFLVVVAAGAGSAVLLVAASKERMSRITAFLDPWAKDVVNDDGYQLINSLIAIGRGEYWGVGLGGSIQKILYLPEPHTDFIFAVLGEELGIVGMVVVILLYATIVVRAFIIGGRALQHGARFAAYLIYGLGLWLGMQAFINIGVNLGVLPTKGLTLPLFSYGGSSMIVTCVIAALMLRVGLEVTHLQQRAEREVKR